MTEPHESEVPISVPERYLWALEVLSETVRNRRASRTDYQRARRIVGSTERVTGGQNGA